MSTIRVQLLDLELVISKKAPKISGLFAFQIYKIKGWHTVSFFMIKDTTTHILYNLLF